MTQRSRLASSDRGAAAVEFALVAVLLFTLVFGIIQYSLYFWQMQSGEAAAREVARYAAVGYPDPPTGSTFCDFIDAQAIDWVSPLATTVDASISGLSSGVGSTATVTVTFAPFSLGIPFVPVPSGNVQHIAETRVENVVVGVNDVDCP